MIAIESVQTPDRDEVLALAGGFEPAWYTTLNADQARPAWFLARREGRLLGFLTVFDPSGSAAEVSAFVDPANRRQGVFTALLAEARRIWNAPGRRWLLVADRSDAQGAAVAARLGTLSFTESTLGLGVGDRPAFHGLAEGLLLAEAGPEDVGDVLAVQGRGDRGGGYREFVENVMNDPQRRMLVLKHEGKIVGTGGLGRDAEITEIFGLAIDPDHQGKGWGRALASGLLDLGARDTVEFRLEVDSTNGRAEALYRSLGFTDRKVIDYYQVEAAETS